MKDMIIKKYKDEYSDTCIAVNLAYFESLYKKYLSDESVDLLMNDGKNGANCFPLPLLDHNKLSNITIQDYEKLNESLSEKLKKFTLEICKMQAGLGTSVKRDDLLKKFTDRTTLGAKGTDLFIEYEGKMSSIAEVQLLLAEKLVVEKVIGKVKFKNLVNSETSKAVENIWNLIHSKKERTYKEVFSSDNLMNEQSINQLMMPTINESGNLTFDREAPGGHAFLGFYELSELYKRSDIPNEITAIGNGEDLRSNPDGKILSWMVEQNIPAVMITTTKLEKDKKGGQIALVMEDAQIPYVTIVEKAQAEKTNQLEYFEELGLRDNDNRSLFNTNIVLLNKKILKQYFNECLNLSNEEFYSILAPDLIKNTKEQNGQKFVQLEGAIGSTLLNLDKYFRLNFKKPIIHFLNLAPENRERFFLPIKKREDFDQIYNT